MQHPAWMTAFIEGKLLRFHWGNPAGAIDPEKAYDATPWKAEPSRAVSTRHKTDAIFGNRALNSVPYIRHVARSGSRTQSSCPQSRLHSLIGQDWITSFRWCKPVNLWSPTRCLRNGAAFFFFPLSLSLSVVWDVSIYTPVVSNQASWAQF